METTVKHVEVIDCAAIACMRYPDAEELVCTCGTDVIDLLVEFGFDKNGKPGMRDSELVRAAREGRPVILNNVAFLTPLVRLALRDIIRAADEGRDTFTIAGLNIFFRPGFKVIAVVEKPVFPF